MKIQFILMVLLLNTPDQVSGQVPADIDLALIGSVENNVGVRNAGDALGRLFVINQQGIIRIIDSQGNLLTTPFLDIQDKVRCCGERGLLGLDFHPNYRNNGYFYVSYSLDIPGISPLPDEVGDTIIERYQVSANDVNVANPDSGTLLMRVYQDAGNHNGGNILFGPDGFLYIGLGDGGAGGDFYDNAQNLSTLLGAILRIDVDGTLEPSDDYCGLDVVGTGNYGIPDDNPFVGDGTDAETCDEIWTYGWRNPFRWSFDRLTGDMFIGDVGQASREEISFQHSSSTGGENYGWNCREGDIQRPGTADKYCEGVDISEFEEPIIVKAHSTTSVCAITGGYRYRGPVNSIQGHYIYGDYCSGQVWFATTVDEINWTENEWTIPTGVSFQDSLSSFGEDERGNLYISNLVNGNIYKLIGDIPDLIFANGYEYLPPN